MAVVRIGNKTVLADGNLIMDDGEIARIDISLPVGVPISTDAVRVRLRFSDRDKKETNVRWQASPDGGIEFEFTGWNGFMGTTFRQPIQFGSLYGRNLYLHIAHTEVSGSHVVHYLILQDEG